MQCLEDLLSRMMVIDNKFAALENLQLAIDTLSSFSLRLS